MKKYYYMNMEEKTEKEVQGFDRELGQKLTKQIAKGGGITFLGDFVGKLLKLLFQIVLTRVLGASAYGLYALGYTVLGISSTFSQLGLGNGTVRFGSIYRSKKDWKYLKGTIMVSLIFSFLAGIVLALFLFAFAEFISVSIFHEPGLIPLIKVFSFSIPFYTFMTVTAFAFRIFRQMQYDVGLRLILHPILLMIYTIISFLLGYRLLGVIYGFLISSILSAVIGIYLLWKIFPELISNLKPLFEVKKLICFSLTVLLISLSSIMIFRTDRIMLGILSTAVNVGVYNAAAVMASQSIIFLSSFNAIFSPIISHLHSEGRISQLGDLFKVTTKWIFTLTLPLFLIFILFSQQFMGIFGEEFRIGWLALICLSFSQLLNAAVGSSGYILTMAGNEKLELSNNLFLGILNIGLNLILIPKMGFLGAAIATGISIGLVNTVRLIEVYIIHKIHPYKLSYWKPIVAGLGATMFSISIKYFFSFNKWFFIIGIVLFILIYTLLLLLFKLEREDKIVGKAICEKLNIC